MQPTHVLTRLGLCLGAAIVAASAAAQGAYPQQPVRIVVPHPPGGFNDTVSRKIASELSQTWGQPVLVENRPGASQQIGTSAAAKAAPDGYTLLNVAFSHGVNPSLYPALPYDTVKDFVPVAWLGRSANLLAVPANSPYDSVQSLIDAARQSPGDLTYGSAGPGSSPHLSSEMLALASDVELTHVPYKGGAPMLTDLMSGQIVMALDNVPNLMPYVKAGKLRGLAVTSAGRSPFMPALPTLQESGVPNYEMIAWHGLVAPAGTPNDIVQKINADVQTILDREDIRAWFANQGVEPVGGSTQAFGAFIDEQIAKWAEVVKASSITLQ